MVEDVDPEDHDTWGVEARGAWKEKAQKQKLRRKKQIPRPAKNAGIRVT